MEYLLLFFTYIFRLKQQFNFAGVDVCDSAQSRQHLVRHPEGKFRILVTTLKYYANYMICVFLFNHNVIVDNAMPLS